MSAFGGFSGLLIHSALVYRRQEEGGTYKKDRFGQPSRDELPSHVLECRITAARGGETFTDRTHDVVEVTHRLFCDNGADISEQDVITVLGVRADAVRKAFEEDPESALGLGPQIVTKAEVLLARVPYDGTSPHHVECKVTTQRQSGEAR